MRKQVRKLRHWKQRWDKNAKFIWRRTTIYLGKSCNVGSAIPKDLELKPTKLRRFWEAGRIELAEFEDPDVVTGQVRDPAREQGTPMMIKNLPEGVTVEKLKGRSILVRTKDGDTKVGSRGALNKLLKKLHEHAAEELKATEDDSWLDDNSGGQ